VVADDGPADPPFVAVPEALPEITAGGDVASGPEVEVLYPKSRPSTDRVLSSQRTMRFM
jgi:hypothetical protein